MTLLVPAGFAHLSVGWLRVGHACWVQLIRFCNMHILFVICIFTGPVDRSGHVFLMQMVEGQESK